MMMNVLMLTFQILSTLLTIWKMIMRMIGNLFLIVRRWMEQLALLIKT